jgi:hypothetical protein
VLNAVRPSLATNGIALMQFPQNGARTVAVTTVLAHKSGQFIKTELRLVFQVGSDPQALGSAITYLRRYAITSVVGVAPEEDDDGRAAGGGQAFTPASAPAKPASRVVDMPQRQSTQAAPPAAPAKAAAAALPTITRLAEKKFKNGDQATYWVLELSDGRQAATKDRALSYRLDLWRGAGEPIASMRTYGSGWLWLEEITSANGESLAPGKVTL